MSEDMNPVPPPPPQPPLFRAIRRGPNAVARALSEGADPNARWAVCNLNINLTPLHFAMSGANPKIVRRLVAGGADVMARDAMGLSPLHYAATQGKHSSETMQALLAELLEGGIDINARDAEGWTPLHRAALWGSAGAVDALVEGGANVKVLNWSGETALDIAQQKNNAEVVGLLLIAAEEGNRAR
jgi:ankyrin repeat protein